MTKNLRVASWNILFDTFPDTKAKPQSQRIKNLTSTLQALPSLDILGLYEVEATDVKDCGQEVTTKLGMRHATRAVQGRPNEGILLTARTRLQNVRTITLDPDHAAREAIIAEYGDITVVALHLIAQVTKGRWRTRQIKRLLKEIGAADKVIIMGDFNCLPSQKPRRLLETNGFNSVMKELELHKTGTFPTEPYKEISVRRPIQRRLIPNGLAIDDIYFKNLKLVNGGMFEGDSDHYGLWADLQN